MSKECLDTLVKDGSSIEEFLQKESDRPWLQYHYNGYKIKNYKHRNKVISEQPKTTEDPNLSRPILP